MIEDEEQSEQDPLMELENTHGNGVGVQDEEKEQETEADGEMSDEYISTGNNGEIRRYQHRPTEKEHYYEFSPISNRPSRQPMMGVNVSTLNGMHKPLIIIISNFFSNLVGDSFTQANRKSAASTPRH